MEGMRFCGSIRTPTWLAKLSEGSEWIERMSELVLQKEAQHRSGRKHLDYMISMSIYQLKKQQNTIYIHSSKA